MPTKKDEKVKPKDRLDRDDMVKVIEAGGSVLHEGRLYSKVEHLPSDADLAGDDPVKRATALEALEEQRRQLDATIATLNATPVREPAPSKYDEPAKVEEKKADEPAKAEPIKAAHVDEKKGK